MTINNFLRIILLVLSAASLIAVFMVDATGMKFLFLGLSVSTFTTSFNNRKARYAGATVGLALLLIAIYFLNFTPDDNRQAWKRENGWYNIYDNRKDSISTDPIITVKDFIALELDSTLSSGKMVYQIYGTVSKHKRNKWADATERAIGKRIGFVYNGEVITSPLVNMRIDGGRFSISSLSGYDMRTLFHQIRQEKADSIARVFEGWDREELYSRPKNEIDSILMEIDYWEASEMIDMGKNPMDHYWYGNLDTVEYKKLENSLYAELQKPNLGSSSEDYMKSQAYHDYKSFLYDNWDYMNLMFQGFLFHESPKGLYGYLIDDIIQNRFPDAPSIRDFVKDTDNRDDEIFAINDWQKRIWRLMNLESGKEKEQ